MVYLYMDIAQFGRSHSQYFPMPSPPSNFMLHMKQQHFWTPSHAVQAMSFSTNPSDSTYDNVQQHSVLFQSSTREISISFLKVQIDIILPTME